MHMSMKFVQVIYINGILKLMTGANDSVCCSQQENCLVCILIFLEIINIMLKCQLGRKVFIW